jgi:beta-lactam-binding protein with PASTA domain
MKFIKTFSVHIIVILVTLLIIFTVVSLFLNSYTRHGESLSVPDIRGLKIEDAIHVLEQKKLRYIISDSLYFDDKPKLSILEQNPAPQSKVKEGRFVYITINSNKAPQVNLPNLLDVSLRQAEAMLASTGLKVGKFIYKPDIAKDVVLDVQYMGASLQFGVKIGKGTAVDLVLGDGLGGESIDMPDLTGLTLEEANNLIQSSSLTLGSVVYMGSISDSASAKVVRQNPPYTEGATINGGLPIDLFIRQ